MTALPSVELLEAPERFDGDDTTDEDDDDDDGDDRGGAADDHDDEHPHYHGVLAVQTKIGSRVMSSGICGIVLYGDAGSWVHSSITTRGLQRNSIHRPL